jgi:hypothetical protein
MEFYNRRISTRIIENRSERFIVLGFLVLLFDLHAIASSGEAGGSLQWL